MKQELSNMEELNDSDFLKELYGALAYYSKEKLSYDMIQRIIKRLYSIASEHETTIFMSRKEQTILKIKPIIDSISKLKNDFYEKFCECRCRCSVYSSFSEYKVKKVSCDPFEDYKKFDEALESSMTEALTNLRNKICELVNCSNKFLKYRQNQVGIGEFADKKVNFMSKNECNCYYKGTYDELYIFVVIDGTKRSKCPAVLKINSLIESVVGFDVYWKDYVSYVKIIKKDVLIYDSTENCVELDRKLFSDDCSSDSSSDSDSDSE